MLVTPQKPTRATRPDAPQPTGSSAAERLRQLSLPPREAFDASHLAPGCVKSFFLDGIVPADTDARADIERCCVQNRQSRALAWLFLKLEEVSPGQQQSLQLANPAVHHDQRLGGADVAFLAQWLVEWLGSLPLLDCVDLGNNFIGEEGSKALADVIARNLPLRHLILASGSMPAEGVLNIATALLGNTALRSLDVSENTCNRQGISAFGQVLAHHDCALQALDFSKMQVQDTSRADIMRPFEEGLAKNRALRHIGLASMTMTLDMSPTRGMVDALQSHPGLTSINLALTQLDKAEALALVRRPQLESIDLSACDLCRDTVGDLLAELERSTTLRHLALFGNTLKGQGQRIADMIASNRKLESLQLRCCGLLDAELDAIVCAARSSRFLQALDLRENGSFTDAQARELDQHLLLNRQPRPAQLNNAADALHLLVSRENSHQVPLDLTRDIASLIGAMRPYGVASLEQLIATAGRLPSLPPKA